MNRRALIGSLIAFLGVPPIVTKSDAQEEKPYNGNWWLARREDQRIYIVAGFTEGMELGNDFSFWRLNEGEKLKGCISASISTYRDTFNKYLAQVTVGQIVDGLDELYKDYRNRLIPLYGAVWIVLQGIAGEPKDKLDLSIENWRKNAKH